MAIIIPSRNIYEISNNKIIDNFIDAVTVESTNINAKDEYNVVVNTATYDDVTMKSGFEKEQWTNAATVNARLGSDAYIHFAGVAVGIRPCYVDDIEFWIDRIINNAYISQLVFDKNEYGITKINYSVAYEHQIGKSTINVTQYAFGGENTDVVNQVNVTYDDSYGESRGNLPELKNEATITYTNANSEKITAKANVSVADKTSNSPDNANIIGYIDERDIQIVIKTLLCGVEMYSASIKGNMPQSLWGGDETATVPLTLEGTCEKYVPIRLYITFNGNTIGIDLTDGASTKGDGDKPFTISRNELLQNNGKVNSNDLAEHLANNILQQYKKGKETATLLCDISDYYNESGEKEISITTRDYFKNALGTNTEVVKTNGLYQVPSNLPIAWYNNIGVVRLKAGTYTASAIPNGNKFYGRYQITYSPTYNDADNLVNTIIGQKAQFTLSEDKTVYVHFCSDNIYNSAEPRPAFSFKFQIVGISDIMTFKHYDEVIPMVRNSDGFDVPMSLTSKGNGKSFTVLGNHIFYDGAVWQEITLQESGEFVNYGNGTFGLEYVLSTDRTYYICKGIGESDDVNIIIASYIGAVPVAHISQNAFKNSNIESITIPDTIKNIGADAFYGCSKLAKVEIDNIDFWCAIEFENAYSNPLNYAKLYVNDEYSSFIKIPQGVTSISSYAFVNYNHLREIIIPTDVVSLGNNIFGTTPIIYYEGNQFQWNEIDGRQNVSTDYLYYYSETEPTYAGYWHYVDGVPTIWNESDFAFELNEDGNSYSVSNIINTTKTELVIPSTFNGKPVTNIIDLDSGDLLVLTIPDSIISSCDFSKCLNLERVNIGAGITSNIVSLFYNNCYNIKYIGISQNNPTYSSRDGIVFSKNGKTIVLYPKGRANTYYQVPASTNIIGDAAFWECQNLVEITFLGTSLDTTIGSYAFANCYALETIDIPNNVKTVGEYAFQYCPVKTIRVPSAIKKIPAYSFAGCEMLEEVIINRTVEEVDENAFEGCTSLNKVIFYGTPDQWDAIIIWDNWFRNLEVEFIY